jgi:hypothetical protein
MLAVAAQPSAADPVTGVLNVVGTTATQQLDAVAHGATAIPLPASPPTAVQVVASAARDVAAVPQAVESAGDAVHSNASGLADSSRVGEPDEGSGSSNGRPLSPPSLHVGATRAGHVVASPTPARGDHAASVPTARRIVSSRIDRVAATLTHAERRVPAAHALAGRASRVAGALLGAVTNARDTLATISVPPAVSLLRTTLTQNPFTLLPASAGAGTSAAQSSVGATALATSLATNGSAQAAPSSVAPLDAQQVQRLATDREASAEAHDGMHGPPEATSSEPASLTLSATQASDASLAKLPVGASATPSQFLPAPPAGGFAPASSASAAGGLSAATFLALAALLPLAAPRALRRLQRADTSWRLAQFSLIPARPG